MVGVHGDQQLRQTRFEAARLNRLIIRVAERIIDLDAGRERPRDDATARQLLALQQFTGQDVLAIDSIQQPAAERTLGQIEMVGARNQHVNAGQRIVGDADRSVALQADRIGRKELIQNINLPLQQFADAFGCRRTADLDNLPRLRGRLRFALQDVTHHVVFHHIASIVTGGRIRLTSQPTAVDFDLQQRIGHHMWSPQNALHPRWAVQPNRPDGGCPGCKIER